MCSIAKAADGDDLATKSKATASAASSTLALRMPLRECPRLFDGEILDGAPSKKAPRGARSKSTIAQKEAVVLHVQRRGVPMCNPKPVGSPRSMFSVPSSTAFAPPPPKAFHDDPRRSDQQGVGVRPKQPQAPRAPPPAHLLGHSVARPISPCGEMQVAPCGDKPAEAALQMQPSSTAVADAVLPMQEANAEGSVGGVVVVVVACVCVWVNG